MQSVLAAFESSPAVPRTRRFKPERYVLAFLLLILPYNDNGCGYARLLLPLVVFFAIYYAIAIVFLRSRERDEKERGRIANRLLLGLLALLLWLDAGPVIMALGLMEDSWSIGYTLFALVATHLLFLASGWRRGELLPAFARIGILLGATALISSIPWNPNKADALLTRSVLHQPLDVVQREMDGEDVFLVLNRENWNEQIEGVVGRDFDLAALQPDSILFSAFGHGVLTIEDGAVESAWFLYD